MRVLFAAATLCAFAASAQDDVVPPRVLTRVDATVPVNAAPPEHDHVLLEFIVGTDGKAADVHVIESAGAAWDQATVDALKQWVFAPATHEGVPTPSRTVLGPRNGSIR